MKVSSKAKSLIWLVSAVLLAAWVGRVSSPDTVDNLEACRSNLKNIGTAMEMYSTDWSGKYPPKLDMLVPKYLSQIPVCPAAGFVTYRMEYGPNSPHNDRGFEDYYYLYCAGEFHEKAGVPVNQPGFDGMVPMSDL